MSIRKNYQEISEKLKALGHPARLEIVAGLMENECNVTQIQEALGLPQSTISQHLRILRNAGIIKGRREHTKVCYRVVDENIRQIIKIIGKK